MECRGEVEERTGRGREGKYNFTNSPRSHIVVKLALFLVIFIS